MPPSRFPPGTEEHARSRRTHRDMPFRRTHDGRTCSFLSANSGQNGILPTVRGCDGACPPAGGLLPGT